nr:MAG TPA: hypothetical protein [Caudoviricetes sp.]
MSNYFEVVKKVKLFKDSVILAARYEEAMEKMKLLATKQYDRSMYFLLEYDDKTDKLKQIAKSKNPETLIEKLEEVD